jgi:hypothetical protein
LIHIAVPAVKDDANESGEILRIGLGFSNTDRFTGLQNPTQENWDSLVRCRTVAERLAGKRFQKGIEIVLHQPRQNLTGGSWEMMLCLGMISLLTNTPLKEDVTGTGRVSESGQIGSVGSYEEKVDASRVAGCKLFLAPSEGLREKHSSMCIIPTGNIFQAWQLAKQEDSSELEDILFESVISL